jgi:phosphonate transport system permease protein
MGKNVGRFGFSISAAVLIIWSLPALQGANRELDFWQQVRRLSQSFFPPDFGVWPELAASLAETLRIATLATVFGSLLALGLAFLGSPRFVPAYIRGPVIVLLALVRSIPSLILAVLAVALFGVNPRAGVLALAVYSAGYLGRFFLDILEQSDPRPAEWMRLHGAPALQIFVLGQWPNLAPAFWSKILWMWEYNIRSAAIIGYVGAGGIGMQLQIYQEYGQWDRFSTALLMIFGIVLVMELLNYGIKKRTPRTRAESAL